MKMAILSRNRKLYSTESLVEAANGREHQGRVREHLHCYLERIGPGADLDLVDPADHIIPLTPGTSPVNYFVHFDVPAGAVAAGLYQLVVSMTYLEPTGAPGPMAGFVEGPMLQFYTP